VSTYLADRPDHGAVVVAGPDATAFLQSLLSQDLDGIADGEGARSLLLTPQGKLDVTLRLLRVGDEWWLDCEAAYGERLATALTRYRIRVDAEIRDRSSAWGLLEVRGHEAVARVGAVARLDVPDAPDAHVEWDGRRVVRSDWPDRPGVDVVGPVESVRAARDGLLQGGVEPFPPGAYEAARIEAGVPRLGVDVDERTIPQEAFLELDAVSFTKGCFLGQELVCRIDTRGHVNRHLRRIVIDDAVPPDAGSAVVVDGKEVGVVTSAAAVPDHERSVALAMVRREVEPPADAEITSNGRTLRGIVEELPRPAA
jgi:folate-binding protein YgfZ